MSARSDITCEVFEAEAADLALDHVGGRRRAVLLDHASGCARCDEMLGDLCAICDRLLDLAPHVEPPIGFEARTVARMAPRSPAILPRLLAAAVAALLLVVVGVALGRMTTTEAPEVTAGSIVTDDGTRIGTVELQRADTSRVVLTMDGPSTWDGTWTCEVRVEGRWVEVGSWSADEVTNHVWAAGIDESLVAATHMRVLGDSGAVIATAALHER